MELIDVFRKLAENVEIYASAKDVMAGVQILVVSNEDILNWWSGPPAFRFSEAGCRVHT